jgi:glycerophosphoryl diester phosphodiesterase
MKKLIIGHRGHPFKYHENTLKSFQSALENGADYIEFDIRKTNDNVLIAFHDPFILNGKSTLSIASLTFDELQKISATHNFSVARIEEVFLRFSKHCGFDIELKEPGCEEEVFSLIKKYSNVDSCFFTSFFDSILRILKSMDKAVKTGYLIESSDNFDKINTSIMDYLCPEQKLYRTHKALFRTKGFSTNQIAVWTVDEVESMKQFFSDPYIFGVITNRCDLALQAYTL